MLEGAEHLHLRQAARALYELRALDPYLFEEAATALDPEELEQILGSWQIYARPDQLRPADCKPIWFLQAGRGYGKTRTGGEECLDLMEDWGPDFQGLLLNKTLGDARKININGRSGLIACARRRGYELRVVLSDRAVYHPGGGVLYICTPEEPDGPRGYECNYFWADEVSSWKNANATWDNIMFAWRLPGPDGGAKRGTVTTTPKPNPITYLLLRNKLYQQRITVTRGSTRDNLDNLASDIGDTLAIYEGTRHGRQEVDGELMDEAIGTFDIDVMNAHRVSSAPEFTRVIVSVDPSIDDKATSDDAGISVIGQVGDHAYVLGMFAVENYKMWPKVAARLFVQFNCSSVIAEINQGGKFIVDAIHVAAKELSAERGHEVVIPVKSVWQSVSKKARAEPIGALYELGRVHHVGAFPEGEKEMSEWVPGMASPNVMDAVVQGVAHLLLGEDNALGPLAGYLNDHT